MQNVPLPQSARECIQQWGAARLYPKSLVQTDMDGRRTLLVHFADVSICETAYSPGGYLTLYRPTGGRSTALPAFALARYDTHQKPCPTGWTLTLLLRALKLELRTCTLDTSQVHAARTAYTRAAQAVILHPRTWRVRES